MSLFSRLFGGGSTPEAEPEIYQGYRIFPEPVKDGGSFRIAARIETGEGDSVQTHQMIRADTCSTQEEAVTFSVAKAKMLIDEQGDRIFR